MTIRKTLGGTAAVVTLAAALVFSASGAASAATNTPTPLPVPTIAPGLTGDVGGTIVNQNGTEQSGGGISFTLIAPPNSHFTSTDVWANYVRAGVPDSGSSRIFQGCVLSQNATRLDCTNRSLTVPAAANGNVSSVRLTSPIQVDTSAAPSTTYSQTNGFIMTGSSNGAISGGNTTTHFRTPADAATPVIDPVVGTSAAGVLGLIGTGLFLRRKKVRNSL